MDANMDRQRKNRDSREGTSSRGASGQTKWHVFLYRFHSFLRKQRWRETKGEKQTKRRVRAMREDHSTIFCTFAFSSALVFPQSIHTERKREQKKTKEGCCSVNVSTDVVQRCWERMRSRIEMMAEGRGHDRMKIRHLACTLSLCVLSSLSLSVGLGLTPEAVPRV